MDCPWLVSSRTHHCSFTFKPSEAGVHHETWTLHTQPQLLGGQPPPIVQLRGVALAPPSTLAEAAASTSRQLAQAAKARAVTEVLDQLVAAAIARASQKSADQQPAALDEAAVSAFADSVAGGRPRRADRSNRLL